MGGRWGHRMGGMGGYKIAFGCLKGECACFYSWFKILWNIYKEYLKYVVWKTGRCVWEQLWGNDLVFLLCAYFIHYVQKKTRGEAESYTTQKQLSFFRAHTSLLEPSGRQALKVIIDPSKLLRTTRSLNVSHTTQKQLSFFRAFLALEHTHRYVSKAEAHIFMLVCWDCLFSRSLISDCIDSCLPDITNQRETNKQEKVGGDREYPQ